MADDEGTMQGEGTEKREDEALALRKGSMRLLFDETQEMTTQRAARDAQLTRLRCKTRSTTLACY